MRPSFISETIFLELNALVVRFSDEGKISCGFPSFLKTYNKFLTMILVHKSRVLTITVYLKTFVLCDDLTAIKMLYEHRQHVFTTFFFDTELMLQ